MTIETNHDYMSEAERRDQLLAVALKLAKKNGGHYASITRNDVARAAKASVGTVSRTFGGIPQMKAMLIEYAIREECLPVIAQAIAVGDKRIKGLNADLRSRALDGLR